MGKPLSIECRPKGRILEVLWIRPAFTMERCVYPNFLTIFIILFLVSTLIPGLSFSAMETADFDIWPFLQFFPD